MNYFGTNLSVAGHYFWDLKGDRMEMSKIYFKDIPFDPYDGQKYKPKGTVTFMQVEDYSICVITGSCIDGRNGTVSTFFVKEKLSLPELKERILSIPIAKKIIDQMPFNVLWE